MKKKFCYLLIFGSFFFASCVTRAPSDYELDKRAGRLPKKESKNSYKAIAKEIHEIKGQDKVPIEPIRIAPRVENIWIYNQELNDSAYLQGTFVFVQIDNGYWLSPSDQKS